MKKATRSWTAKEKLEAFKKIRNDPIEFAKGVFTLDEADGKEPIKRFPIHLIYIVYYIKIWMVIRKIVVPKSRRMKMSWTNIMLHVWLAAFHSGQHIAFTSKKEEDADWLIRKRAKFILENLDPDIIPIDMIPKYTYKYCVLEFPEIHSTIQGFPQGADQMRQYTFSAIFADEFAFWPLAEATYSAAKPTLEGGGRFTGVSSPAPGFFKRMVLDNLNSKKIRDRAEEEINEIKHYPMEGIEIWRNKQNGITVFQLHYTADPAKRSAAWKENESRDMPIATWNQEYELKWESYSGVPVYRDYRKLIHGSQLKLKPHLGLPLLRGWDFGLCYSDDTEVLTQDGWKFFYELCRDDFLATRNPETKQVEYYKPTKLICNDYTGEMLGWESNNLSMLVTPDHIIPYTKRGTPDIVERLSAKQLSNEMQAHRFVDVTAKWEGKDHSNIMGWTPLVFAKFMGIYLSEGSVDFVKNRVVIYQNKRRPDFQKVLDDTCLNWKWAENSKGGFWRVTNRSLAAYLSIFGKAKDKRIPECIKFGKKESILEFIKFYTIGDGHIRTRPNKTIEHTIFTTSKIMADDLQECALKVGWSSSIRNILPTESYYKKENRFIKSSHGYSICFKKRHDRVSLLKQSFSKKHYEGKVYCVTVPNHVIYVRRNGKPHWNGNCPAAVICQLREGVLYVIKEFTETNMGIDRFADIVLDQCKILFPQWGSLKEDWCDCIDPAGFARVETDESCCAEIMAEKKMVPIPGAIVWEKRRKSVEKFLTKLQDGEPCFQIDLAACPVLVRGFEGGYRYPDKMIDLEPNKIKPLKDEHSHPHDGLQMITTCITIITTKSRKRIGRVPRLSYSRQEKSVG